LEPIYALLCADGSIVNVLAPSLEDFVSQRDGASSEALIAVQTYVDTPDNERLLLRNWFAPAMIVRVIELTEEYRSRGLHRPPPVS
jgi:hypothetical protein